MSRRVFKVETGELSVRAEINGDHLTATIEGHADIEGAFVRTGDSTGVWNVNGARYTVAAVEHKGTVWAAVDGRVFRFELVDPNAPAGAVAAENMVAAPMPGKVIKLFKAVGDTVEEGEAVIVVEAMKMEHTLRAPKAGKISEIRCIEGQQVEANVPLVEIEAED
ncbi:MAG: biotin/lipoyl-containing protein [bacterium]